MAIPFSSIKELEFNIMYFITQLKLRRILLLVFGVKLFTDILYKTGNDNRKIRCLVLIQHLLCDL